MHVHKSHGKGKSRSTTEDQHQSDEDNFLRKKSNTSNEVNMTDTNTQGIYFYTLHLDLESNILMLLFCVLQILFTILPRILMKKLLKCSNAHVVENIFEV